MSKLFYAGAKIYHRISYIKEQGLVFGIDNGTSRFFVRFDCFEDFESWYHQLHPNKKTVSEVIMSDKRKLILDIDNPDNATFEKLLMFDFERHIRSRIHDVFFLLDIGTPNIIFYSMCSDDKISYHAVVSNFMFSAQTCLGLCTIISSGQIWESCVDKSVYKMVQFIRVEDSTKFEEYRWKKRLSEPGLCPEPRRKGSIRNGLLSDPVGTHISEFTTSVHCSPKELLTLDDNMSLSKYVLDQFKIGKLNKNGLLSLYRKKPGFCVLCNRKHDRENAFIKYYAGNPVFICWRYLFQTK